MSIMWKYLDKRAAAIKAIGDYDNMQFIIRNTKDEITVESDRMVGVGSPNMARPQSAGGRGEDSGWHREN